MAGIKAQTWSLGLSSLTHMLSDISFILRTAFFRGEKMVSGTCRSRDLTALGLEEESLREEFWSCAFSFHCGL